MSSYFQVFSTWLLGRWVSGRWSVGLWSVDLIKLHKTRGVDNVLSQLFITIFHVLHFNKYLQIWKPIISSELPLGIYKIGTFGNLLDFMSGYYIGKVHIEGTHSGSRVLIVIKALILGIPLIASSSEWFITGRFLLNFNCLHSNSHTRHGASCWLRLITENFILVRWICLIDRNVLEGFSFVKCYDLLKGQVR